MSLILELLQEIDKMIDLHKAREADGKSKDFIDHYLEMLTECSDPESIFYGEAGRVSLQVALDNLIIGGDGVSIGMHSSLFAVSRSDFFRDQNSNSNFYIKIQKNVACTI